MKKLCTFIAYLMLWMAPWSAYSATQTMSACTTDAWDTAYAAASNGDIIAFPAGECSVTMTKAIAKTGLIIQGAGTTNTTVTGGFTVSGSAANGLKITGIKFLTGPAFTLTYNAHQVPENIRITGNLFSTMDTATFWGTAESSVGAVPVSCVVDNNTYDSMTGGGTANYVYGDCDSTTGFPFTLGTSSGVYFEDNTVTNAANMGHFVASRCASRYVVRYNSFGDLASWDVIDAHDSYEGGGRENGLRGSWTFEVYNNKFAYGSADKRVINLRGGQGVVFNNFFSQAQAWNPIKLTSYNICNEICAHDDALCSTGGWNDHINATYVWGNKANCGADLTNCAAGSATSASNGCLSGDPLYPSAPLVENTDYTLSAMPGYTAYAYPHPLRNAGETLYTVTPSVSGTGGTLSSIVPASVVSGEDSPTYTQTPANGYRGTWSGTCGATGTGATYQKTNVTADCTVVVTFDTIKIGGVIGPGITYDGNGSDSGTVPATLHYRVGGTVTVSANTGTLAKTGYTFSKWNTAADGSGTDYDPADTFTISGNVTLYAKWAAAPERLIGNTEAGTGNGVRGYVYYVRAQAIKSGNVTSMHVASGDAPSNVVVRIAIYSDAAGSIGTLLKETASVAVPGANQSFTVDIDSTPVVATTYYWIAAQTDGDSNGGFKTFSENGHKAEAQAYGAFPATPSPFDNAYSITISGWGIAQ